MRAVIAVFFIMCSFAPAVAQDVLIIGELHDNPAHHAIQAEKVREFRPKALVFEMLTREQAEKVTVENRIEESALENALDWRGSGWPDFAMYYPIFKAAPDAKIYGAGLPREKSGAAISDGVEAVFGAQAARFGLLDALPKEQQKMRETLQQEAHCNALPDNFLSGMVTIQRLRDAMLAREVLKAIADTGGPVAVITGNGHARRDWGAPAVLGKIVPEMELYVIGQTEDGAQLTGGFDEIISAPAIDRSDPCEAFQ